ncbi:YqgE/AlgH family protein [uncultured Cellulomonas sp.]|uniref:YqgE/AlgH family protein n=1 Tax=uncultured Cellulomonas sp. TaxID=189682 RepID=UPI0028ED0CEF|nr:YqgE/AlgH family protein [uncultured Cellulomonas sp.]
MTAGDGLGADDAALRGRLLVARPSLREPTFHRTVILLLDHSESGAVGIVLNRPTTVDVGVVLPDWHPHASDPPVLFQGGPVGLDGAMGVVALPRGAALPPEVDRVTGRFGLVDLDAPPESVVPHVGGVRVFAGYAGWGDGQLEAELTEGSWFVVDAVPDDVLTAEPDGLWRRVLRRQGGDLAIVSTFAEDASLN